MKMFCILLSGILIAKQVNADVLTTYLCHYVYPVSPDGVVVDWPVIAFRNHQASVRCS